MAHSPTQERPWLISPLADLVLITLTAVAFSALIGGFVVVP